MDAQPRSQRYFSHLPPVIKSVSKSLSPELICQTAKLFIPALEALYPQESLRIAVLGLNPHAGEQGYSGSEDDTIMPRQSRSSETHAQHNSATHCPQIPRLPLKPTTLSWSCLHVS